MTPERWRRIEELVEAARGQAPQDQSRLLDNACGDDDALRRQVEAILASYDQVGSFLENPAGLDLEPTERGPVPPPLQAAGTLDRIGPYRLEGEISHGGMGSVFLATRGDGEYQQKVAIKLIRPGLDSKSVARRFRGERQILANLDHPHIARLLDGGTTDDGRPYFVMELIEGTPIDTYCDRSRLSLRQRIELFEQVCDAVAYAHRNLVVHRDLKPANILVTDAGAPKLLDFGIAKLLDPESFPHTVEATQGPGPMTPPYASPEQILGQPITTASDVYSLGVLLYKLLTGRLPFDRSRPPLEIAKDLAKPPTLPSAAVTRSAEDNSEEDSALQWSHSRRLSPQQLSRRLRGDLDNIVLKALRREPERRYSSVEQLGADLKRHLDGLPIQARRASLRYRTAKFLRRNRIAVAVVGVILALIVGSAGVVGLQSVEIGRQRALAEQRLGHAEQVADALVGLFETLDPNETAGEKITAKEILDRGVDDLLIELKDQPRTRAAVQNAIGKVYVNLGLYAQAQPVLEGALETRLSLLGERHLEVAESQYELAILYWIQDDPRSEELHKKALRLRRELLGPEHADVARSLRRLGNLYNGLNRYSLSKQYLQQAIDVGQKTLGPEEIADIINEIALIHIVSHQPKLAESLLERSLTLLESALGTEHLRLHAPLADLAWIKCEQGDYPSGLRIAHRAMKIQKRHLEPRHSSIAHTLNMLSYCYSSQGENRQAIGYASRALEIRSATFGTESPQAAIDQFHLGIIHFRLKEYEKSKELLITSVNTLEALKQYPLSLSFSLARLGLVSARLGEFDKAIAFHQKSIAASTDHLSLEPEDRQANISKAHNLTSLGEIYRKQKRPEQAVESYLAALSFFEIAHPSRPFSRFTQALALTRLGRLAEARVILVELYGHGWRTPEFLELCQEHGLVDADDA